MSTLKAVSIRTLTSFIR